MILLCTISLVLWTTSDSVPFGWELVDMTYTFDENIINWPGLKRFSMEVVENGTQEEGYWLQIENYESASHVGTHMDAPCHFAPGKWCVDEIPLKRLAGPAAVIDITDKAQANPDATVDVNDLKEWEGISGRSLNGTIVVMRSGWGRKWNNKEAYLGTPEDDASKMHYPGFSTEAAQWLVDNRDIYGVMSDSLAIDPGNDQEFRAHRILLDANIYGLENVANVEEIPIVGAFVHIMPMKMGKASAAPTRVIAKYPKVTFKPKEGKSVTERSLREVIIFSK